MKGKSRQFFICKIIVTNKVNTIRNTVIGEVTHSCLPVTNPSSIELHSMDNTQDAPDAIALETVFQASKIEINSIILKLIQ